jgi:hypothetical protein
LITKIAKYKEQKKVWWISATATIIGRSLNNKIGLQEREGMFKPCLNQNKKELQFSS